MVGMSFPEVDTIAAIAAIGVRIEEQACETLLPKIGISHLRFGLREG
jgi:hypothetical protein